MQKMAAQTIWHLIAGLPRAVRDNSSSKSLMGKHSGILYPDEMRRLFCNRLVSGPETLYTMSCVVFINRLARLFFHQ